MKDSTWKELFHPEVANWFEERFSCPTDIQKNAWASVQKGNHILLTAPTGSGKTLAAFLWALNQLLTGVWPSGATRVLYISPLKALNNDIQRNLLEPLRQLKERFDSVNLPVPDIRVLTRSGDTPQSDRQRMIRKPPEILVTTPESLNLLLSSKRAVSILTGITTVILDEIHAVADNKRGTHLMSGVERVAAHSGEFQRIALSATVKPLSKIADFTGGYRIISSSVDSPIFEKRNVAVIRSSRKKKYDLTICFPEDAREKMIDESWWPAIIDRFVRIIEENESTLFFANSRRLTEKITRMINEQTGDQTAWAHHGSLSREIRTLVEEKLKAGELKAIVATNSLELGIDIGHLDEIILVQAPFSVTSSLQRIGRGGHSVGDISRARMFPLHGMDFILSAVTARASLEQDIEEITIPEGPLDVLAQIIISISAFEAVPEEELYALIRCSYPYRNLSSGDFYRVLQMLSGKYADSRIRELEPRISWDRVDGTVLAKSGAMPVLYMSGGTIPDRGYFDLRLKDSQGKIGELDEEFVWERSVGDVFSLGTQTWKIQKIDHQKVEVIPVSGSAAMAPFWKGEGIGRSFHLMEKTGLLLEELGPRLEDPALADFLQKEYRMDTASAFELIGYLNLQKEHTGTDLPSRHHLVVEHFFDPLGKTGSKQVILYTLWGGKVNAPFAVAFRQAWEDSYGYPLQVFYDDVCIMFNLPHEFPAHTLLTMVTPGNLLDLLHSKLESTGLFGGRFRENASRALLLPKLRFNRRMPLWFNRLRSKKLLHAVKKYDDFPILLETWKTCLNQEFDLDSLKILLEELAVHEIRISETTTFSASPFSSGLVWQQTNQYMYKDDTPLSDSPSSLRKDILQEVMFSSKLRPRIPEHIIAEYTDKLQRTYPGYAPASSRDLLDWVKERVFIPLPEWEALKTAVDRVTDRKAAELIREIDGKIETIRTMSSTAECITALETRIRMDKLISREDKEGMKTLLAEWLQSYGPVDTTYLYAHFPGDPPQIDAMVEALAEERTVIVDRITEGSETLEICDTENLEFLLRLKRRKERPEFKPLPFQMLSLFIAHVQGLTREGVSIDDLKEVLERLLGYSAPAPLWEKEILPARIPGYLTSWMDSLFLESDLVWCGTGKEQITFSFEADLDIHVPKRGSMKDPSHLVPDNRGRYTFWDLKEHLKTSTEEATLLLWKESWKGHLSNDSFDALRKGILRGFRTDSVQDLPPGRKRSRSGFARWKSSHPVTGNWFLLPEKQTDIDLLEEEELKAVRVRQVLSRYGILCREILSRETAPFSWKALFSTMRKMELSGELVSGCFFEGIPGLQFTSTEMVRALKTELPRDTVYWINARDPASLCGKGFPESSSRLPNRIGSNHLVYHGENLVITARKNFKHVEIHVPPEHPELHRLLACFKAPLVRDFDPSGSVKVEKINGQPASENPYTSALLSLGFVRDYKHLILRKRFQV